MEAAMWWTRRKEKCPISIFFLITGLHCLAILLFTRGFLLTRTELPYYSHRSDVLQSPCPLPLNFNQTDPRWSGWTKPAVDRLVIIVLDALRFDFVVPSTFFEEKKPWMDKLQVLHKWASQRGSSAKLFKAIADPPTTSLQRLKGLTTGGLPTFIDVGNSFGAPEIVEDNWLYQLVQNGKRVVMMGDDTWLQLFPHHFNESYAFPSFNVKDLDTVDNGCIKHLRPSLYKEDWDVLIAHFLGVDHAGHIFGVDSIPMVEKLEQYNGILEQVIQVLESQSGPGGLHENTLLLVMGDHGQTVNGDHGGGDAEEVETAIFSMSLKKPPFSLPLELDTSSCRLDLRHTECLSKKSEESPLSGPDCGSNLGMEEKYALASFNSLILQLRCQHCLAFPFLMEGAVIGRVNPELFALAAGTWNLQSSHADNCKNQLILEEWMQNYVNALCINSWQVKKYIDAYSASSVIGFSNEDLLHVSDIYAQAQDWSHSDKELVLYENESCYTSLPSLKRQINAYFKFLASVAELARSKWTEFNLMMMGTGFGIMITSLFIHFFAIKRVDKLFEVSLPSRGNSGISFWLYFAYAVVAVRASSVLSNSYILEEGKVANFLLATTGILNLRYSIVKKKMLLEALVFVLLTSILRFTIELGLSKQAVSSVLLNFCPSWMCGAANDCPVWIYAAEIVPMLSLILLAYILYKSIACISCNGILKYVVIVTFFSYMLIAVYWALESNILSLPLALEGVKRNFIPRLIYGIGFAQLSVLALVQLLIDERSSVWEERVAVKSVAMLSAWSSTVIILSGKQGPLVALASIVGGWCIMRCLSSEQETKSHNVGILNLYSFPVTQWSLLAVGLFFCTGHWCAFDGLRYAAAFIGFDEFILIPQAILLTIETFGFSHILPIFGLPLVVAYRHPFSQAERRKQFFFMQLCEIYLIYGLIVATTVTFTILCVIIQRRHLMVWGLFAPKFVFDVVGLILTDILICLASLYYFGGLKVDTVHDGTT